MTKYVALYDIWAVSGDRGSDVCCWAIPSGWKNEYPDGLHDHYIQFTGMGKTPEVAIGRATKKAIAWKKAVKNWEAHLEHAAHWTSQTGMDE